MRRAGDPSLPLPESLVHNMSESLHRNETGGPEPLRLIISTTSDVDDGDNWLIHEFDNSTLIDNAPYVGLRKVDSLTRYLLVSYSCCAGRGESLTSFGFCRLSHETSCCIMPIVLYTYCDEQVTIID